MAWALRSATFLVLCVAATIVAAAILAATPPPLVLRGSKALKHSVAEAVDDKGKKGKDDKKKKK